jgi:hypothetical protein
MFVASNLLSEVHWVGDAEANVLVERRYRRNCLITVLDEFKGFVDEVIAQTILLGLLSMQSCEPRCELNHVEVNQNLCINTPKLFYSLTTSTGQHNSAHQLNNKEEQRTTQPPKKIPQRAPATHSTCLTLFLTLSRVVSYCLSIQTPNSKWVRTPDSLDPKPPLRPSRRLTIDPRNLHPAQLRLSAQYLLPYPKIHDFTSATPPMPSATRVTLKIWPLPSRS